MRAILLLIAFAAFAFALLFGAAAFDANSPDLTRHTHGMLGVLSGIGGAILAHAAFND